MLSLLKTRALWPFKRGVEEEVANIWTQLRRAAASLREEVTEVDFNLVGNAALVDGRIRVPSATSNANYAWTNPVTFDENEDFYIRLGCNIKPPAANITNTPILSCWDYAGVASSAWGIFYGGPAGNNSGKIYFGWRDAAGIATYMLPEDINPYNTDTVVEVSRKAGKMHLFINGVFKSAVVLATGNAKTSTAQLRTHRGGDTVSAAYAIGDVWDIQIRKGEYVVDATHDLTDIPEYVRATYSPALAEKVCAQYTFRRNSLDDEAGNGKVTLFGNASVSNGRVSQTNVTTSYYTLPYKKFGQGDFTIDVNVNITRLSAQAGANVFGQWRAGAVADDNNRWLVLVSANRSVSFFWALSAAANDNTRIASEVGVINLGQDHHIVVERVNGMLTIYVDGKAVASGPMTVPIRGESNFVARSLSAQNVYTLGGRIWNMRIVDRAVYLGKVVTKPTFPKFPALKLVPFYQWTFADNSPNEELTGKPLTLLGTAKIENNRLVTTAAATSALSARSFLFKEDEDFTIEMKIKPVSIGSSGVILLGVWNVGGGTNNSWCLGLSTGRALYFNLANSAGTTAAQVISPAGAIALNAETHVAAVRRSNIVTLYVDGKSVASLSMPGAAFPSSLAMTTRWADNNGWMTGERWDIRLTKVALYTQPFTPSKLDTVVPPTYTPVEQSNILRQYSFAFDKITDDVADQAIALASNSTIANGVLNTLSSTTRYGFNFSVPYFGAEDFTVEFKLNYTALTSYSFMLAQWFGGGSNIANTSNSWGIYLSEARTISWIHKQDNAQQTLPGVTVLEINRDYHIVVERYQGVISLFVDGVLEGQLANTKALPQSPTELVQSVSSSGVGGPSTKQLWDIRFANSALYKGTVPVRSFLPKLAKTTQVRNLTQQIMVRDVPDQEISDHCVNNVTQQVMVVDGKDQETSDHDVRNLTIQILVKDNA